MLNRITLVIASAALIMSTLAVIPRASAAVPYSLRPAGDTRYAMVQSETVLPLGSAGPFYPTGLSTSVTIPTGKKADVMVLFCAVLANTEGTQVAFRGKIGNQLLLPNGVGAGLNLSATVINGEDRCINFYRTNVSEGTKAVKVEWGALTAPGVTLYGRSMIVILNIH